MWLTGEEEAWLRDSLRGEPEWLQRMVLANFGICEPDMLGRITARALQARLLTVTGTREPRLFNEASDYSLPDD